MASNNVGVWNQEGTSLALSVASFFWETAPFRAAVLLLLLSAGVGAALRRRGAVQRRALELETVVAERCAA